MFYQTKISSTLQSAPMPYTSQEKSLTLLIHSKVIHLWSHICWENFFNIQRIKLNSGNAQAQTNGIVITMQTKKQRFLHLPLSLVKFHGISAGKRKPTTWSDNGKCVWVQRKSISCTQRHKQSVPTCTKGDTWLQHVGHPNTLCARLTQLITNHVPTGEYRVHTDVGSFLVKKMLLQTWTDVRAT